jgi:glutamyl endopeptidase
MARKAKKRLTAGARNKRSVRTRARAPASHNRPSGGVTARKAVPDPVRDPLALESFMAETNGGGSVEKVPGFDVYRAITSGFQSRRIAGPTTILARPDGGFFSEGGVQPPLLPRPAVGSSESKSENVIGVDSRVMVTDTSTLPWRCICHLEVEYEFGPVGFGTGFLIGPKSVLTAAHVLVNLPSNDPARRRTARQIRVIPGRSGTIAPYGYFESKFADCKIPDQWLPDRDSQPNGAWDFAVIPIPDDYETKGSPTAERLGYFGLKCFTDADAESKTNMLFVNNAGYPYEADKPYGSLWYNAGRVRKMEKTYIEYMVDTEGGQSGSPVYFYDEQNNQRYVIAVHTTGDYVNRGLRITEEVFETIKKWTGR